MLAEIPAGCDLAELRADRLDPGDVPGLVRGAPRPTIVTVRRREDGGAWVRDEAQRVAVLESALAAGAALVDVELGSAAAALAAGADRQRVIVSAHGVPCRAAPLREVHAEMRSSGAARLKLVPDARSVGELRAVRELLADASAGGPPLCCFATGRAGTLSRLLAPSWGSWGTYGAAGRGEETAEGQLTALELLDVYDVTGITGSTRRYALIGRDLRASPSPAMHRAAYVETGLDARYFPIELDETDEVVELVGPRGIAGLEGLAVTAPFKEQVAGRCEPADPVARLAGAVNTVTIRDGRWRGHNTDAPAAVELVSRYRSPEKARVAVVGAGGTGKALAAAFRQRGAQVCFFNRSRGRARDAVRRIGGTERPLAELAEASWDVLLQTTPLGRDGESIPLGTAQGTVLDVVYGPRPTPLVSEARRRGLPVIDGLELLVAQAVRQFELLTGRRASAATMDRAGRRWLDPPGRRY